MNKYLFFAFVLTSLHLKAQIKIGGFVKDSSQQPLPFVNIFVQENDTTPIIAFGSSNDKGYFSFETPILKRFIVKASALGYETKSVLIENKNRNIVEVNFIMLSKELVLKETIVRGSSKIIQKSDTITFDADRFRDSTERNLEELLTKIPGLDVSKEGVITVQGQPIKKILIEGDDLTGRNYQLMSKNMSADVVDKIQVIDKFNENKLLKGIKRSDDKVINITLKEKRKKLLFGNAVVGLGNDARTNNSLNLFGFYKKLKTITFGNFNTMGQVSTADQMIDSDFSEENEADNQRSLLKTNNSLLIDIGRTPSVSLSSQSVRFNRAALVSTHFTLKPIETLRLKGALTFSNDRVRSYVNNDYRYQLGDSLFLLSESNVIQRKPTVIEAHLEAQADLSTKSLLRYKSDIRKSILDNNTQIASNNNLIFNQLNTNVLAFSNTLDFTYRINDFQAIMFNAVHILDNSQQNYTLNQSVSRYLPSVFLPLDSLSQSLEKPMTYFALNGQWLYSKRTFKLSNYWGYVNRTENFISELNGFYQNAELLFPNIFKNNTLFRQNNYYIGVNVKEEWLGVQWFSDISSGYYQTRWAENNSKNGYYALPVIGFKRKIKEKHTLLGTYSYNFNLPQTVNLANGYILTDYRSLERGSSMFITSNSHIGILNYTYGKFEDEFLGHFNIIYTANNKGYRDNWYIDSDFNVSQKVENLFFTQNTIISGALERYMSKVYMRLKVRPTVSLSNYWNTVNSSDIRATNTINSTLDISLRSAFLKWFNFHLGTTLNQSNIQTSINNVTESFIKNHSVGAFVDFHLKLGDKLNGKIDNEVFYVKQNNNSEQKYYFINASAQYDIIKTKLLMGITTRNLLNTRAFINSYITDFSTQINSIKLLPRYILIDLNFRF